MDSYRNQARLFEEYTLDADRQRLESLLQQAPLTGSYQNAYAPARLGALLRQWGQGMMRWLTQDGSPRIAADPQGGPDAWRVYDPMTQRTHYFAAEASLRAWLESRYYE